MDAHDQGARPNGLISTPSGHSHVQGSAGSSRRSLTPSTDVAQAT